jgi:hypothetical protein
MAPSETCLAKGWLILITATIIAMSVVQCLVTMNGIQI